MVATVDLYVLDDQVVVHERWSYVEDAVLSIWNPCLLHLGKRCNGVPHDLKLMSHKDLRYARNVMTCLGAPRTPADVAASRDTNKMLAIIDNALRDDKSVFIRQF